MEITTAIAIYGACVSTVLAVHELCKRRPQVKVSATLGHQYNAAGEPSEPLVLIKAINTGAGAVPLNGVGWLNRDKTRQHIIVPWPPKVLPMEVSERKSCTTVFPCRSFRDNLDHKKIVGVYFQDESGKLWIRKMKGKDKERWLAAKEMGWRIF